MKTVFPLGDCIFVAHPNDKGFFVGRCQQFPYLRSRPRKLRLDAIDEIIDLVRDKIRNLDSEMN
jgi:hypothetical protein